MVLWLTLLLLIECSHFPRRNRKEISQITSNYSSLPSLFTPSSITGEIVEDFPLYEYLNEKSILCGSSLFYGLAKPYVRLPAVCTSDWNNLILRLREREVVGGSKKISIGIYRTNDELPVMRVDRVSPNSSSTFLVPVEDNNSSIATCFFPGKVNKSLIIVLEKGKVTIICQDPHSISKCGKTEVQMGAQLIMLMDYQSGVSLKYCATFVISLFESNPLATPAMIAEKLEAQAEVCQSTLLIFTQVTASLMNEPVSAPKRKDSNECIIL